MAKGKTKGRQLEGKKELRKSFCKGRKALKIMAEKTVSLTQEGGTEADEREMADALRFQRRQGSLERDTEGTFPLARK